MRFLPLRPNPVEGSTGVEETAESFAERWQSRRDQKVQNVSANTLPEVDQRGMWTDRERAEPRSRGPFARGAGRDPRTADRADLPPAVVVGRGRPGRWDAAIVARGGRTVARLPFMVRGPRTFRVLTQPPLTPFLGPWITPEPGAKY